MKRRLRGLWSGASHFVREAGQWEGCPTGPQGDPRTPAGGRGHLPFPALSADSAFLLLAGPFPFFSFLAQLKRRHRQAEGVLLRQGAPPAPTHRARRPELRRRPRPLLPPLPPFPVEFTAWGRRIVSVSRAGTCWPTGLGAGGGEARRVDREGLALATTPAEFGRFCRFLKTCRMRVKDSSRQQRPRPLTPAAAASRLVLRTRSSHLTVKSDLYSV